MKQLIMRRAWEIAREGQGMFGGKVSEYLSEALKMAWAEQKSAKIIMIADQDEKVFHVYGERNGKVFRTRENLDKGQMMEAYGYLLKDKGINLVSRYIVK